MSFLPAILTGISALSAHEQNRKAQRTAEEGLNMEREAVRRKNDLFDTLYGLVTEADKAGEFNPDKRIADVNADSLKSQAAAERSVASSAAILGYKPGDTLPLQNIKGVSESYDLSRRAQDRAIRDEAFGRKLNAYRSLDSPTEGITVGRDINNAGMSRSQDTSGLWAAIMPFIQEKKKAMAPRSSLGNFNTVNTAFRGAFRGR